MKLAECMLLNTLQIPVKSKCECVCVVGHLGLGGRGSILGSIDTVGGVHTTHSTAVEDKLG